MAQLAFARGFCQRGLFSESVGVLLPSRAMNLQKSIMLSHFRIDCLGACAQARPCLFEFSRLRLEASEGSGLRSGDSCVEPSWSQLEGFDAFRKDFRRFRGQQLHPKAGAGKRFDVS